jgi:HAD superfamily hydrolase (TIGR01509 family)
VNVRLTAASARRLTTPVRGSASPLVGLRRTATFGDVRLIIFDFDGVVADSEALANQILAEGLSEIGLATTTEEALHFYMGRRWSDCTHDMEQRLGRTLPEGFLAIQIATIHARLIAEVQPVAGVLKFLEAHAGVARCIGSSSSLDYIGQCLERMAMTRWFEHRFSGQDIERGKPHPDLFLKAAATLGVPAANCVVIEDSPMGVMAGKAAAMLTIGLCAGSHVLDGHASRLAEAGADIVVSSYAEAARFLNGNEH